MNREIVRDTFFLGQKSEEATEADIAIFADMRDTLRANHERCVGMAANMRGTSPRSFSMNATIWKGLSFDL